MANIVWLSVDPDVTPDSYWDQALLKSLFKDEKQFYATDDLDEAIVVLPGARQADKVKEVNAELAKLKKCKLIINADEENLFPLDEIDHPDIDIFSQCPTDKFEREINWIPLGPARTWRVYEPTPKDLDWFFAGQITHESRYDLSRVLKTMIKGKYLGTEGFAQGMKPEEYDQEIRRAKVVPAPEGVVSPDSFRLYEALENGAVPVTRNREFWDTLFGDYPFKVVDNWDQLRVHVPSIANNQHYRNEVFAWWQRYKLDLKDRLLGTKGLTTVIVPASAIKSHPSTEILDETIASIRHQLPDSRIILTFDGIRPEKQDKEDDYNEFVYRALAKANNDNIYPFVFNHHAHQVEMARVALEHVKTPTIVYVEQDTPFTDGAINWDVCEKVIREGKLDLVRFHFEASIPKEHMYMMLDGYIEEEHVMFFPTCQWSQRPHMASTAFYRRILDTEFSPDAKSFIEDKMHGVCHNAYRINGKDGWHSYRLGIFGPMDTLKRTYHTDGRAGEEKYDDTQVF